MAQLFVLLHRVFEVIHYSRTQSAFAYVISDCFSEQARNALVGFSGEILQCFPFRLFDFGTYLDAGHSGHPIKQCQETSSWSREIYPMLCREVTENHRFVREDGEFYGTVRRCNSLIYMGNMENSSRLRTKCSAAPWSVERSSLRLSESEIRPEANAVGRENAERAKLVSGPLRGGP